MSTPQVKPNRTPCLIVGALGGCLFLCLVAAIAGGGWFYLMGPGRTAPIMGGLLATPPRGSQPIQVPTSGSLPGQPPAPGAGSQSGTQMFTGVAPFTVSYPLDWDVTDDEEDNQTILFVSPDVDAYALIMYEPVTSASADSLMTSMVNDLPGNEGSVKVVSKKTNPDGSIFEELTYEDSDLGGTTHAYARIVKTKTNEYLIVFGTLNQDFNKFKETGSAIVNSFSAK